MVHWALCLKNVTAQRFPGVGPGFAGPEAYLIWGTLFKERIRSCHEKLGAGVGMDPCKGEGGS